MATFLFNNQNLSTMQNIYKISAIVFLSLTMVITACKKDEQIIEGCTDITATNYQSLATSNDGSCIYAPEIEGCTDISAMNFLSIATSNDGSCIYAYDIALGTWSISPDCDEIDLGFGTPISLNEQMPESIDVVGDGDNSLSISMNGSQVSGNIDNEGNILVNEQTISVDFSGIPIPVQVSGTGKIESENSGYMDLTYSGEIDIIPNVPIPIPFTTTCHIILSK